LLGRSGRFNLIVVVCFEDSRAILGRYDFLLLLCQDGTVFTGGLLGALDVFYLHDGLRDLLLSWLYRSDSENAPAGFRVCEVTAIVIEFRTDLNRSLLWLHLVEALRGGACYLHGMARALS